MKYRKYLSFLLTLCLMPLSVSAKEETGERTGNHYRTGEQSSKESVSAKDDLSRSEVSITLNQTEAVIQSGTELRLTASVSPEGTPAVWSSGSPKVASVDPDGTVRGIRPGIAVITAEAEGMKSSCTVTVLFTDVPASGKYFSVPVYWASETGITNGYTDPDGIIRTFRPQNNCTREAVVTFLWRLAGKPEPETKNSPFSDVQNKNAYYYKAVLWAAEQGITKGYNDGTFRPDDTCLREHVVTFIYRYAKTPAVVSAVNPFNDVKTSDYYYKASVWAAQSGIAKGYSSGQYAGGFGPKLDCLREHVVTFLYRGVSQGLLPVGGSGGSDGSGDIELPEIPID